MIGANSFLSNALSKTKVSTLECCSFNQPKEPPEVRLRVNLYWWVELGMPSLHRAHSLIWQYDSTPYKTTKYYLALFFVYV